MLNTKYIVYFRLRQFLAMNCHLIIPNLFPGIMVLSKSIQNCDKRGKLLAFKFSLDRDKLRHEPSMVYANISMEIYQTMGFPNAHLNMSVHSIFSGNGCNGVQATIKMF